MNELLNVEQAAQMTGLKPPTIRLKLYRREIAYVKLGRAVRIPRSEIDRIIRDNTIPRREAR